MDRFTPLGTGEGPVPQPPKPQTPTPTPTPQPASVPAGPSVNSNTADAAANDSTESANESSLHSQGRPQGVGTGSIGGEKTSPVKTSDDGDDATNDGSSLGSNAANLLTKGANATLAGGVGLTNAAVTGLRGLPGKALSRINSGFTAVGNGAGRLASMIGREFSTPALSVGRRITAGLAALLMVTPMFAHQDIAPLLDTDVRPEDCMSLLQDIMEQQGTIEMDGGFGSDFNTVNTDRIEIAQFVYSFFHTLGVSDMVIAAILGNWQQESDLNPEEVENSIDDPNYHNAIGIHQMDGERKMLLLEYAGWPEDTETWKRLDVQLKFMFEADEQGRINQLRNILTTTYPDVRTAAGKSGFGAWEGYGTEGKRLDYAESWYNSIVTSHMPDVPEAIALANTVSLSGGGLDGSIFGAEQWAIGKAVWDEFLNDLMAQLPLYCQTDGMMQEFVESESITNMIQMDGVIAGDGIRVGLTRDESAIFWGKPTGSESGRLDTSKLDNPEFMPNCKLAPPAARALEALNEAFKAQFGKSIPPVGGGSCYRDYQGQLDAKARSGNMAATPGWSNHGWGLAIDFTGPINSSSYDSPEHLWMVENAGQFGWFNPCWARKDAASQPNCAGKQSYQKAEPWHWEFDIRTSAVTGGS